MATAEYSGIKSHIIFAEDTAFGTAGTPTGNDYVDKVTNFNHNINNNMIRSQGIGEGRNATSAVNGTVDITGSLEYELTDPDFMQYLIVGYSQGSGTSIDPYKIVEANCFGYTATTCPTISLEADRVSCSGVNDDVLLFDGVGFNSWSMTGEIDSPITVSTDWTARNVTSSTSTETYVRPANRPFTFVDASMTIGSDTVAKLQNFTVNGSNNNQYNKEIGSRLISLPTAGVRRYDFSFTVHLRYDDAATNVTAQEIRGYLFDGTVTGTTPTDSGEMTALNISFDLVEGATSGDRVVNIDFESCYINDVSEPIPLEGGKIEVSFNGFALSGLTDGSDKVPIRWWTVT